ncbi:DNA mismatch repair protein MutT [Candidatus Woesearchaeota archaeon CG10_big_fil_rev_8_21_14_0_10_34_8]|nr:MAG: DNA mismatch repair protein MutT [Candidatus Woesearchaeota archaeon CG10_big_fil_rev_8_21_14_0_10_34_8]
MAWKILSKEYLEKNKWINLKKEKCQTPEGDIIDDYYVLELQDVSCAVAITKDKELILIKEYKNGVKHDITQLPCGYVDKGESAEQAAKRELLEETGYKSEKWISLGKRAANPGRLNHYFHFFLAKDVEKVQEPILEPGESVKVIKCSLEEAKKLLKEEQCDLTASTGLFLAEEFLRD